MTDDGLFDLADLHPRPGLAQPAPASPRPCADCGAEVPWSGRGSPRLRCPDCHHANGVRAGRIRPSAPETTFTYARQPCRDCGARIPWDGRGQAKHRCPTCAPIHARALHRARWTGRTVEEEKAREREPRRCVLCRVELAGGVTQRRCADCNIGHLRAYNRAWRYGTTLAEEYDREQAAGCRICGQRPSELKKQWCDTCTASGRVKVYRRAIGHYKLDHETAALVSAATECAICARPLDRRLTSDTGIASAAHIDHCHASVRVRGVLCGACNRALGMMQDDIGRMLRAVDYLTGQRAVVTGDDGTIRSVGLPDTTTASAP